MTLNNNDRLGRRLRAITGDLKLYIEKRVELLLLNVGEHFARMMAESVQKVAGIVLLSGASVCLLVALALYLGELLNSDSLGYVLVSIPLIVAGLMFYYLKPKSMVEKLQNHFEGEIIKAISMDEEQKDENLMIEQRKTEENKTN